MKINGIMTAAVAAMFSTACGYSIKTATDYDRTVHFSNYHTFFIMEGNSSGNALLDQRVSHDVKKALTSRGWIEVPEGEGRAAVVVHAATKTKRTYYTFYDGWGGWRWRRFGTASTVVDDYKVGTVVVDIFDADTKLEIWQGSAANALSDTAEKNASITEAAITKMFAKFPPAESAR